MEGKEFQEQSFLVVGNTLVTLVLTAHAYSTAAMHSQHWVNEIKQ